MSKHIKYTLFIVAFFAVAIPVHAATLSFSSGSNYAVGDTVAVSVVLSSSESTNAVGATILYPEKKLELLSISKAASVVTLWAEEPHYSQSAGVAGFQGVMLGGGWSGHSGRVMQLVFKAKTAGTATLTFSDAQVLANDGKGTNVLTDAPFATVVIAAGSPAPSPTPTQAPPSSGSSTSPTSTPVFPPVGASSMPQTEVSVLQTEVLAPQADTFPLPVIALAIAILLLAGCLWFVVWRLFWQKKIHHIPDHGRLVIEQQFNELKEALSEEMLSFEHAKSKRALNAEEERFVARFKKMLDRAEHKLEQELAA